MDSKITVIDYGIGNIFSVCNAIKQIGGVPVVSREPEIITGSDRVILPGVGAFGKAVKTLDQLNLIEPIKAFIKTERPFLGICIGMQLLFDSSNEFGEFEGLGIVPGAVEQIPGTAVNGQNLRVPHISWSAPFSPENREYDPEKQFLFSPERFGKSSYYFVHSFAAKPSNKESISSHVEYGGHNVTASITHNNVFGVQFHPERSGLAGQNLLTRFLSI
jgi:imidazole glycerol-phosphate synthase subunit HisH